MQFFTAAVLSFAALVSAGGMCIQDPETTPSAVGTPYAMCDTTCVADTTTECGSPLDCSDSQICWSGICKDKIDVSVCCEKGLFSADTASSLCNNSE